MLTVRTQADLDVLEAEIAEEEKNLRVLKESLDRAENLTRRMIKTLDEFDERIADLDPVIMPLYRNVQTLSQAHQSNTVMASIILYAYCRRGRHTGVGWSS